MKLSRIAVIGGGIIGTAIARQFALRQEDAQVTLFEKEPLLAAHQTGHSAGVVHSGVGCPDGSLALRLCREGVPALIEFAASRGISYQECGKLIVAHDTAQADRLEQMLKTAHSHQIPHIALLDRTAMREVEPHVRGVLALHSPHTAIIDFAAVTQALAVELEDSGGRIAFNSEVVRLDAMGNEVRVSLGLPQVQSGMSEDAGSFDVVVTAGGLQADRLAVAAGMESEPRIVPFAGDYMIAQEPAAEAVRGIVHPVPDPQAPFAGVRFTRQPNGSLLLGPNTFPSLAREKYGKGDFDLSDIGSTLGNKGFWKFASQNVRAAARGARAAVSPKAFIEEAQRTVPELDAAAVRPGPRGVRAQAIGADGRLIDEVVVTTRGRLTQVRSSGHAGATSALAIADHTVEQALAALR